MAIYITLLSRKSNALNTLVSGGFFKPGFQALFKGLMVLLCTEVSGEEFPPMGPCTANAWHPTMDSQWRGTTISCCVAVWLLRADSIGDQCATVDKVLRSLAMPTSVHDDTEFVRYSICHMSQCKSSCNI